MGLSRNWVSWAQPLHLALQRITHLLAHTALGTLNLVFEGPQPFDAAELETLSSIANTRHIIDLELQATHDSLTGLPNRKLLHREIARRCAAHRGSTGNLALMLLELDRFKEVNDALGHEIGDRVLCEIAPRLSDALAGQAHLICRLGGDEFAVLVGDMADAHRVEASARKIVATIAKPIVIGQISIQVGASIGVALCPDHGDDSHGLLGCADVAMYEAKRAGTDVCVYHASLARYTPERLGLMADFRKALADWQLLLYYQPKFDLRRNRVVGLEALVRWQHPRHGLLYPGAFMPMVERSDAIHELTRYALTAAARQQQEWGEQGHDYPMAVNVSARNLLEDSCVSLIEQLTADRARLELEITETALVPYGENVAAALNRLATLGVRLAVDDFSMGHSSLGYLRLLPVTTLKIDRSFVAEMASNEQDRLIVEATIALGYKLGLEVIAEGVEDAASVELLSAMGCDAHRGFHLGAAFPPDDIIGWLTQQSGPAGAPRSH